MATKKASRIETALEAAATDHGMELVTVELAGLGRKPVVRVFLDKEGGITLDEVAEANEWVSETLDELGEPSGPYVLEVSSPGIERPLRKPRDFQRFVGNRAELRTFAAIDGRKQYTGSILSADEEAVTLDVDGMEVTLPYDNVSKAHLKVDIDFKEEGTGR